MTTQAPKTIPERSPEVSLLIKYMKDLPVDKLVTYQDLSSIAGIDVVSAKGRSTLASARHILVREHNIVFECVRGDGMKRLSDEGILTIGPQAARRINRTARRAARKILCAKYEALNKEQRVEHNTYISVLGAMSMLTKEPKINQIKAAVVATQNKLPLNTTLEAFKS